MGAALAGAPITAVIILFELTGEYTIILPLMTAVAMAAGTARLLAKETIYTGKQLLRRGIDLDKPRPDDAFTATTVRQVTQPVPTPLRETTDLLSAARTLSLSPYGMLPVVGSDGVYHGCVTARLVAETLADADTDDKTVADLATLPPVVTADATLTEALLALAGSSGGGLPVMDPTHTQLTGWVTHESVLSVFHAHRGKPAGGDG